MQKEIRFIYYHITRLLILSWYNYPIVYTIIIFFIPIVIQLDRISAILHMQNNFIRYFSWRYIRFHHSFLTSSLYVGSIYVKRYNLFLLHFFCYFWHLMGTCSSVWIDIAFIKCSTVFYKEYRGYLIYRTTVKDLSICYIILLYNK